MSDHRKTLSHPLMLFAASSLILSIGLWWVPAIAGASDAADHETLTASINVPLNEIQEGQWCVAYANVYNYTGPLEYLWGGAYFSGTTQVVGAYMWGEDGNVTLRVVDKGVTPWDTVFAPEEHLQVRPEYDYNPSCEAR